MATVGIDWETLNFDDGRSSTWETGGHSEAGRNYSGWQAVSQFHRLLGQEKDAQGERVRAAGGRYGDLFVTLEVHLPETLSRGPRSLAQVAGDHERACGAGL